MNVLQQWWQTLVQRERIVIIALAIMVTLLLFQTYILTPLYQSRDYARNSIDRQADLLLWMQKKSILAKQLESSSTVLTQVNRASISQRINTSAKRAKLEINRFQTTGDDTVQVWLDNVNFSIFPFNNNSLQGIKKSLSSLFKVCTKVYKSLA